MKVLRDFLVLILSVGLLIVVASAALLLTLPNVGTLETCFTTTMFEVKLCPGSNNYVKLNNISPYVIHAVIAAEDGSFYHHKGFDWHEMRESLTANLSSGKIRRGGSTLTQQLAKNAFLSTEKSFLRKLKEAYLAYAIENRYKKDFILEKYLNVVEFGPKLYGIKAASQHYFQKAPSQLHPLEAAYLAHLLPNPKVYSQGARRGELTKFSRKMIQIILKRMNSFGKLSATGYQTAVDNLPSFPWAYLDRESFHGVPSYSLDAPRISHQVDDLSDTELDEESLDEIMREDQRLQDNVPADLEE